MNLTEPWRRRFAKGKPNRDEINKCIDFRLLIYIDSIFLTENTRKKDNLMWKVINKCQTDQKSGRQLAFFYTDVFKIQPKPVSFCLFFVTIVTYMWIMACHQNQWTCQFATNFDDDGCSMFALQCKYRERDCMVISCLCIQWILFIFSHSRSHAQSLTYSFNESLLSSYLLCAVGSYFKLNGSAFSVSLGLLHPKIYIVHVHTIWQYSWLFIWFFFF